MKIALIRNMSYDSSPYPSAYYENPGPEYVVVSGVVDVEFPPLDDTEVLKNQIAAIDRTIKEINEDAITKVKLLQTKKQELLALTHE